MAGQTPPDKTVYPYNTHIWQPSWCCSTSSIMSLNWYKCYILSCYVTTDYLVFTYGCTCLFVFPGISYLGGIGQWLSLDRAIFPGKYRPGIPRTYKPTNVHTRTCTCTWCVSTWCTWVLDWWKWKVLVLDYEYLKYLSTWPIVLDPNPDTHWHCQSASQSQLHWVCEWVTVNQQVKCLCCDSVQSPVAVKLLGAVNGSARSMDFAYDIKLIVISLFIPPLTHT